MENKFDKNNLNVAQGKQNMFVSNCTFMLYQVTRCNAIGYSNNNEVSDCVYVMQLKFTAVLEKVDIAITIVSILLLCSRDIALIFNRNFNCTNSTERERAVLRLIDVSDVTRLSNTC